VRRDRTWAGGRIRRGDPDKFGFDRADIYNPYCIVRVARSWRQGLTSGGDGHRPIGCTIIFVICREQWPSRSGIQARDVEPAVPLIDIAWRSAGQRIYTRYWLLVGRGLYRFTGEGSPIDQRRLLSAGSACLDTRTDRRTSRAFARRRH